MPITIETMQIPVTFNVTRNKGLVNETSHTVNTTLDFSDYTAEDFMNRAIDSVVIAIQAPLRNPPKSGKGLTFSELEGQTFKAPKPGRSQSRKDPEKIQEDIIALLNKLPEAMRLAFIRGSLDANTIKLEAGEIDHVKEDSYTHDAGYDPDEAN
jgi:hypothetical protein